MPVKSLNSSVLKWPSRDEVLIALSEWVKKQTQTKYNILKIGYFGSYVRGDWGVGSDLDVIIVIRASNLTFHERPLEWDTLDIPVPVDLLIYTDEEFKNIKSQNTKFSRILERESVWIYP